MDVYIYIRSPCRSSLEVDYSTLRRPHTLQYRTIGGSKYCADQYRILVNIRYSFLGVDGPMV